MPFFEDFSFDSISAMLDKLLSAITAVANIISSIKWADWEE